jgi:hypothetical protein
MNKKQDGLVQQQGKGLYAKYSKFFLENLEEIGTAERALRTLLFFVPGRFQESEAKLEFGIWFHSRIAD